MTSGYDYMIDRGLGGRFAFEEGVIRGQVPRRPLGELLLFLGPEGHVQWMSLVLIPPGTHRLLLCRGLTLHPFPTER